MDEKMIRFFQMEAEKDSDSIADEVNRDPNVQNVTAPDVIGDRLYAQIREHEAKQNPTNLSEEEKELIELGKVYKRRLKWRKWYVLAAALVLALMFGVTSIGGPEKVVEKVKWMLGGNQQTNVDSDDERIDQLDGISEVDAYQQIENEFGFRPVKLDYLPEGMEFKESIIYKDAQTIQITYEQENVAVIIYNIWPNYRMSSTGNDIEDALLEEYTREVGDNVINIKHYLIENNDDEHWIVEFEYQNIYYFLQIANLSQTEVEKILDNLFFW